MTEDWLALCRAAAEDVRGILRELPTRIEREPVVGDGVGGDETTAVDAAAERVILERLRAIDGATIVSEEVGELAGDSRLRIVVDPIDGSLNAKRGIPFFSLSIAVADGETMDDVVFGYVHDFGTGEEWTAERGAGVRLNGEELGELRPKEEIEILSFEATLTSSVAEKAAAMVGVAYRLRIMGSLALSLCHLAAGRVDAVCSLKAARAVDIAAAQLLVRERGIAIDLPEAAPFGEAPLDIEGRSRVVAACGADGGYAWACPCDAHLAAVNERGAKAMGFSQTARTHHFRLTRDGGFIQVEVNDAADAENLGAITLSFLNENDPDAQEVFELADWVFSDTPQEVPARVRDVTIDAAFVSKVEVVNVADPPRPILLS